MLKIFQKYRHHPALLIAPVLIILQVVIMVVMGFHFGWLDDVLFELNARGTISDYHNGDLLIYWKGFSHVFAGLYAWKPEVPWYGIILLVLMLMMHVNLALFLSRLASVEIKRGWIVLAGVLIYLGFLLPYCTAPTFTSTALFLAGSSLINLWSSDQFAKSSRRLTIYLLFTLSLGILIRYRVALLVLLVLLPFGMHAIYHTRKNMRSLATLMSPLLVAASLFILFNLFESQDNKVYRDKVSYIRPVMDGFNYDQRHTDWVDLSEKDSILLMAARMWFIGDDTFFNRSYFETVGHINLLHPDIRQDWKLNLTQEWEKADRYPDEYLLYFNWKRELFILLILNLVLLIGPLLMSARPSIRAWLIHCLKPAFFTAIVLIIAVLYKIEGRVLIPMIVLFTLIFALETLRMMPKKRWIRLAPLVILLVSIVILLPDYWKAGNNKKAEVEQKRAVIADLNARFSGKIIVFDYYTSWLLHGNLLEYVPLSDKNQYAIWGEPGFDYFKQYRSYLETICDDISFNGFYNCLKERQDVIFVYSEQRVSLIEGYAEILYQNDLKFKKIAEESPLQYLEYSYLWFPMELNYYELE